MAITTGSYVVVSGQISGTWVGTLASEPGADIALTGARMIKNWPSSGSLTSLAAGTDSLIEKYGMADAVDVYLADVAVIIDANGGKTAVEAVTAK